MHDNTLNTQGILIESERDTHWLAMQIHYHLISYITFNSRTVSLSLSQRNSTNYK